jgi:assimilatory nitrate reductase catalytic subunit
MLTNGRFFHPGGKAQFIPTRPAVPRHAPDEDFPFVLNTGRVRDQWHTMTRTGRSARLAEHRHEPYVDMHAQDALVSGVRDGELVRVSSRWGSAAARVRTSGEMARGAVFMPIHWSAANSSDARVGAVVNPVVDAISGEPEFKHTPARVEPLRVDWHGALFTREPVAELDATWWTRIRGDGFVRYELGGRDVRPRPEAVRDRQSWARELLGATSAGVDYLDYVDSGIGVYRGAYVIENRLMACVCIAPTPQLPSRTWLASLFAKPSLDDTDRRSLLAGRPLNAAADMGPTVCSCFRVGRNTIQSAAERHCLTTAAQVGERLKAGTNCGSCLPEIRQLLATLAIKNS